MLHRLNNIITFVFCTLIAGAQELYTTIDVMRPGCFDFPIDAQNVLVVNNAVQQPDDYGHQSHLAGQIRSTTQVNTDSAILYFLTTFTQSLGEQDYFTNVDLLEKSQNTSGQYFRQQPLTSLQTDHLRKKYDAEILLVLNRLILSDMVEDFITDEDDYLATLEVHCVSVWHIFLPESEQPRSLTLADTLFWENRTYRRSDAINNLPDRRNALLDMSIYSARESARKLVPHWEQRDRYFYTHSDRQMKVAVDSLYRKRWDAAINLWYAAYQRGNNALKARAAANMAATFEIEGDLNSAFYWANQAADLFGKKTFFASDYQHYTNLTAYVQELSVRIKEEETLAKQIK